jgi:exodeoxyribonuclease V gamma subunit
MPLNIYSGNRMEALVEALAGVVETPLSSPFRKEMIVVQSRGMERWLAMELANRLGIWANGEYPFPNHLVWRLFSDNLEGIPEESSFSREVLTWRIMGILPPLLDKAEFSPLKGYLADDRQGLKRFQLAGKIADTFDQYTLFRPEMLLKWESGLDNDWQALLWREIANGCNERHRGKLKDDFRRFLETAPADSLKLPERLSLFGISYLPSFHIEVLAAVARRTKVNLFLMSPTSEYWGDIATARERSRLAAEERSLGSEGNPLLSSLGRLGRDFSDMVIEIGEVAAYQKDLYTDPGESTLLCSIQSDILNLGGPGDGIRAIDPRDRSVQIHSCHSPMREVEVLHDNLLNLLEELPGLEPREIVVMTPDIEAYAPFIAAVFSGARDPAQRIPYSIADRNLTGEGEITATFLKLLDLAGSRLTVIQVLDILESPPVKRRFRLADGELATIRRWLEDTRVRWGMDEADRARLGLPAYRENSWQSALDRLLLGYAVCGGDGLLFNGKLPYESVEGGEARTLGVLMDLITLLSETARSLEIPRTLGEWSEMLTGIISGFIAGDEDSSRELAQIGAVCEELGEMKERSGFVAAVETQVIRSWIKGRLEDKGKGLGFMTGGVTFCAMLPMRSIPFRVIGLIGMNDGAFPRQNRPPGFDLIARSPRRGDRSYRDEDRYLFLESLLSARDCLYISYTGQSIRDNSPIPPSVLVSEFLDAVARRCALEAEEVRRRLITTHRLQAFSSGYFGEDRDLFSYSAENLAALRERRDNPWQPRPFLSSPLPLPGEEWREVSLTQLLRFYSNPARFLLENMLGIRLEALTPPLEEREPFEMAGLESYSLRQEILEVILKGDDPDDFLHVARARGILPPALHGGIMFREAVEEVELFANEVRKGISGMEHLPPLDFRLELQGFVLSGRLDRIWSSGMLRYRHAKLKGRDRISAWIENLVLNTIGAAGYPVETRLIMSDGSISYQPVDEAAGLLKVLLDYYWKGLTRPLRLFPESACAYAHNGEWRLDRAKGKWEKGFNRDGEGDDPYYRLCFDDEDPLNEEFQETARTLLEPMIRHQT